MRSFIEGFRARVRGGRQDAKGTPATEDAKLKFEFSKFDCKERGRRRFSGHETSRVVTESRVRARSRQRGFPGSSGAREMERRHTQVSSAASAAGNAGTFDESDHGADRAGGKRKIIGLATGLMCLVFASFAGVVQGGLIPQANWRLWYVDSEETVGENGVAEHAFDGNRDSRWHTEWLNASPPHPHEIQIDLRATYSIGGFRYLPRQNTSQNGTIKDYEFYVSTDGSTWGSPVATGTFANTKTEKEVLFAAKTGQYVRLRALSEVNGNPWTSAGEINVLESGSPANQAPNGVMDSPAQDMTINPGGVVTFSGTGTDPDGNVPLAFRWNFGASSGIPDSTAEDPGAKQFNNPGTHTVTFTVTDALGLSDPTPATRVITVVGGSSGGLIPQANWRLWYVDSEETVGENGVAENAFDGATSTIWHTEWLNANPPHPHEIRIDLGWIYAVDGFRYLPRQNTSQNGTIKDYEFYVSTDGSTWGSPVATGTFANTKTEKEVLFAAKTGQYVRLRALSEVNGNPWTSAADIKLRGDDGGAGDYYVAVGDSITLGEGDDYAADDASLDGRNAGGGYEPILNNLLTAAKTYPHTVVNEGVSGFTSSSGLGVMPTILGRHPAARYFLIQYGTNDSIFSVPSGVGLDPGDPGYAGSYKDNMQRIISLVAAAGKIPLLAKSTYTYGPCGDCAPFPDPDNAARNLLISDYNVVIDELVTANGIAVSPPDFYSYFRVHPEEMSNNHHPNGEGYQSMAALWFSAL